MKIEKTSGDSGHVGDVTCVFVHQNHVYSAGSDGKIKVWDLNLNLIKEINIHETHIYAIAVDKNGRLYSSSCEGVIKYLDDPIESNDPKVLLQHENEIEAIFCDDDANFFCGDDKGGVTCFENGKFKFQMNIVENVKSLFVEGKYVYTLLNFDLSIHEVRESGNYSMNASIPGKFPVTLFGDKINGRSSFIAILTRDGRGITIIGNSVEDKFKPLLCKENIHEMIVNAMKGYKDFLFSADYCGKVVKSQVVDRKELKEVASGNTESGCANSISVLDENTIFIGSTDGSVKKISFT